MIPMLHDISLRDKTSFKIGGPARYFIEPRDVDVVCSSVSFARDKNLPVLLLGRGSNLLISDTGWAGLVIGIGRSFAAIEWRGETVTAQAGAPLDRIVRESVMRGYVGLVELSGIPGSMGGALVMNAGAFSTAIGNVVEQVSYFDFDASRVVIAAKGELNFGYRSSILQHKKNVVLEAVMKLRLGNQEQLQVARWEILERRKARQPLNLPNCGSIFKHPPGNFAGALIEKAGLKGFRYGNAEISEQHANFIVNLGGATAEEVRHIIVVAQRRVYERSGVLLEPEVIFAGSFAEPLFQP
jgi:UDP-N-acetylmuramate dehydrogenase